MGNAGAEYFGVAEAETSVEDSVAGIVKVVSLSPDPRSCQIQFRTYSQS